MAKKVGTITVRLAELTKPITVARIKAGTTLEQFLEAHSLAYSSAVRIGGETVRRDTRLKNGDIITVIGAISGGC